jgi:hypothetical protein
LPLLIGAGEYNPIPENEISAMVVSIAAFSFKTLTEAVPKK